MTIRTYNKAICVTLGQIPGNALQLHGGLHVRYNSNPQADMYRPDTCREENECGWKHDKKPYTNARRWKHDKKPYTNARRCGQQYR
jgi:hypothetical protein